MKSTVLFLLAVVATVTAAVTDAATPDVVNFDVVKSDVANTNETRASSQRYLRIGLIGNQLLNTYTLTGPAGFNDQVRDLRFSAPTGFRIAGVQAREQGITQGATIQYLEGGVGYDYITLRFTASARRPYFYFVEIWG